MKLATALLIALAVAMAILFASVGSCAIPPGTPGDTVCKAELTAAHCMNFQRELERREYDFKVLEGTAFSTAARLKHFTYTVILKCVDSKCNLYAVKVEVVKGKVDTIETQNLRERHIPI